MSGVSSSRDQVREHHPRAGGERWPAQGGADAWGGPGEGGKQAGTRSPWRPWPWPWPARGLDRPAQVRTQMLKERNRGVGRWAGEELGPRGLQPERNLPGGFFHRWSPFYKVPCKGHNLRGSLFQWLRLFQKSMRVQG